MRQYHKVLYKRYRSNKPSKFQIACYFQSPDVPYNLPEVIAAVLGSRCNLNVYQVGTRTPEIFKVFSDGTVHEFERIGDVLEFCQL